MNDLLDSEEILCGRYTRITYSAVGQYDESIDNQEDHADTRFERMSKTSVAIVVDSYTRFGGGTPWPMHLSHL